MIVAQALDVDNLSAARLRQVVLSLPAHLPVTDEFESGDRSERARKNVDYDSQRTHIEKWLKDYDGPGYYHRRKPGGGAKNFYQRFKCAAGLLWFAEALGVPEPLLRAAIAAIAAAPRNAASECGAFRAVVTWSMVAELLRVRIGAEPSGIRARAALAAATARSRVTNWWEQVTDGARTTACDDETPSGHGPAALPANPRGIDVSFDARTDTPPGRDPDSHSPTLRRYHRLLWSKPLPNGTSFSLADDVPGCYLVHESTHGRFVMSSDSLINDSRSAAPDLHTRANLAAISAAKGRRWAWTIGQAVIFPGYLVDRKPTINGARGMHPRIRDRFDLTLECIRRHYAGVTAHPLAATLSRYDDFFGLFGTFEGYVEFFLFQDLVDASGRVRFYLPFDGFNTPAVPRTLADYLAFLRAQAEFESARSRRIQRWCRGA